ncbi:hypothetical protein, partial [Novilysobacter defluvii]|uniref:hypothetical protein n=1 Tax=Novilysobacter defluvii TaxID=391738 RepID=UPI001E59F190
YKIVGADIQVFPPYCVFFLIPWGMGPTESGSGAEAVVHKKMGQGAPVGARLTMAAMAALLAFGPGMASAQMTA